MESIKRIAVIGTGGVGGYFGGKIAHSNLNNARGLNVSFVARGQHYEEIKEKGLLLKMGDESITCHPTEIVNSIKELESPDLCLVCVKSYHLDEVIAELSDVITSDTIILPLLNGVDIYERVRAKITKGIVLPACVYVGTHIEKPGLVKQTGRSGVILAGKHNKEEEIDVDMINSFFSAGGINFKWQDNPYMAIWEKFMFIAPFSLVCGYSAKSIGEVVEDRELKNGVRKIMEEIYAITNKIGLQFDEDIVDKSLNKANNFPYEMRTSYQRDLEGKGPNEGDLFGGSIIRIGKEKGVPTPVAEYYYKEIQKKSTLY